MLGAGPALVWALAAVCALAAACADLGGATLGAALTRGSVTPPPQQGGSRSSGSAANVAGGILDESPAPTPTVRPGTPAPDATNTSGGTPSGTASPLATSSPGSAATPAPTPAPTAETTPTGARALSVTVDPATGTLGVLPEAGAAAILPTTLQIKAEVLLTNGSRHGNVVWTSDATSVATVDSQGLVTAGKSGGSATIRATSAEVTLSGEKAAGTCTITVKAGGDVDLTVE